MMLSTGLIFLALVSKSVSSPTASASLPVGTSRAGLNHLAQRSGKLYFGSATDNPELNNTEYVSLLSDTEIFGQLSPANSMKWDATEPYRGVFTFEAGDVIANLAKRNGQRLRGHNCVWSSQLPDWLTGNVTFKAPTLASIVKNHVTNLVGHYRGRVYAWDVVNEPINDDGSFVEDIFFSTLNESYIPLALHAARAADPHAKLYINDFNIEGSGTKATAMMNIVKSLKSHGVPIDGIGFESHFVLGEIPTTLQKNMEAFTSLGIEIAVTELDVRMTLPVTTTKLEQQKRDFQTVVTACKNVAKCVGVTVWDFTDLFSWIPSAFAGQGAACPFDEKLKKKPAYDGIVDAWEF